MSDEWTKMDWQLAALSDEVYDADEDYGPEYLLDIIGVSCDQRNCYGVSEQKLHEQFGKVIVWCQKCGTDLGHVAREKHKIPRSAPLLVRPTINLTGANLQFAEDMLRALERAQTPHHHLFVVGSTYCVVKADGSVEQLNSMQLRTKLAEVMQVRTERGKLTDPPPTLVEAIKAVAREQAIMPRLERVVTVPVILSDGRVLDTPGYDAQSCTYYMPTVEGIEVPDTVTQADVDAAVQLLVEEYLGDFPFTSQADRANAIGYMILPFVRTLVGPTPIGFFGAPKPGHGKTKVCRAVLLPGCGLIPSTSWSHSSAELEKKLFAALRKAPVCVFIDNVEGRIESETLEAILTEESGYYDGRVLGASRSETVPVHQVWAMTSNNGVLGTSMKRRALTIYIDAGVEHPMSRNGPTPDTKWRHPDLIGWGMEHRAELANACLVLCRWWFQNGRPEPSLKQVMGSFERFQYVVGGILQCAGIEEFSDNFDMANDDDSVETKQLFNQLYEQFGENWFTARQAVDAGISDLSARGFGAQLSNKRNADGLRLVKRDDGTSNAGQYRIEEIVAV